MKQYIAKGFLFVLIVALLQAVLYALNVGGSRHIRKYRDILHARPDVIYFGDSVLRDIKKTDQDRRPIFEMLDSFLPHLTVAPIDHAAYNLDMYQYYCMDLVRRSFHPKAIVISINPRSFSVSWWKRPEYQFQREKDFLQHHNVFVRLFYRPLEVLKAFHYTPITQGQFEKWPVYDEDTYLGPAKDFIGGNYATYSKQKMKKKIQFFYMYSLSENHPYLMALQQIARILKKSGIKAIFYATPVDFETGEQFLGPRFTKRLTKNIEAIRRTLQKENIDLLDLSLDLEIEDFGWRRNLYPNEHLSDKGRLYVAQRVAKAIVMNNNEYNH